MQEKPFAPPTAPPPESPVPPDHGPLRPVGVGERIVALDALRGFAILGIFFVNIKMMARPLATAFGSPAADAGMPDVLSWVFVKIFCEYKFITMFSLLFGIGMAIQLMRAQAAGRPFVMMYLRRLVVLAAIGLVHALGLWYGDILFAYACCGVVLLAMSRLKGRTLLVTGLSIFLAGGLLMGLLATAQVIMTRMADDAPAAFVEVVEAPPAADGGAEETIDESADEGVDEVAAEPAIENEEAEATDEPIDPADFRAEPFGTAFGVIVAGGFVGEEWSELERIAYAEGPFLPALAVRSLSWSIVLVNGTFSWLWRVIGVFLIGAGIMKLRFFDASHARWHRRCCFVGLSVGLAGETGAALLMLGEDYGASWLWMLAESVRYFSSAALTFGYVGALTLVVHAGVLRPLTAALAFVGRMALTNYLAQSLVATGITYWWGFGRFDTLSGLELVGLAFAIYLVQVVVSALWLQVFRMGPMEWLWRSLTYLRPLPIMRS